MGIEDDVIIQQVKVQSHREPTVDKGTYNKSKQKQKEFRIVPSPLDKYLVHITDTEAGLNGEGVEKVTVHTTDKNGQTLLHRLILLTRNQTPKRDIANLLLLEHDADPNVEDGDGYSPWKYNLITKKCYNKCFLDWCKKKANDKDGKPGARTLLTEGSFYDASEKYHKSFMAYLLGSPQTPWDIFIIPYTQRGPDNKISDLDVHGRNSLFYAILATYQHSATCEVIKASIEVGLDPGCTDKYGNNLAHIIALNPKIDTKLLDLILPNDSQKIFDLLTMPNIEQDTPLHSAGKVQNYKAFKKLRELLPEDYIERNGQHQTGLMCFCFSMGSQVPLKHLFDGLTLSEKYIMAKDGTNNTALHYAIQAMSASKMPETAFGQVAALFTEKGFKHENTNLVNLSLEIGCSGYLQYRTGSEIVKIKGVRGQRV
jgi:hypothetical protein